MKNTLKLTYTVCYDTKCMHNFNKKCKRAIPLGDCRRRERYCSHVVEKDKKGNATLADNFNRGEINGR